MAKKEQTVHVVHPFDPLYNSQSRILILGSFPSVKSREQRFFYGHPQNRFWSLMARLLGEDVPRSIQEKKDLMLRHHIALWDTIRSCDIIGSSDSSISNVVPNDLSPILQNADVRQIFTNGRTSWKLYEKYIRPQTLREGICLPSTSPANAAWSMDRLAAAWNVILSYLEE